VVGIVGDDESTGPEAALDQAEDVGVQGLGAVEREQVDGVGERGAGGACAILFRLQSDEWRQTSESWRDILEDAGKPPLERLRVLVHTFIRSECEEAGIRTALNDAAPLYRDAPEARERRASARRTVQAFMQEVLPGAPKRTRALAADLITTTMSAVGKQFSATARTAAEVNAYAAAMADMFCAYLRALERSGL